jgi:hypothetical protein
VDARHKAGHDGGEAMSFNSSWPDLMVEYQCINFVMAGHSRPKDGVLSHAYVPAIHVLFFAKS